MKKEVQKLKYFDPKQEAVSKNSNPSKEAGQGKTDSGRKATE